MAVRSALYGLYKWLERTIAPGVRYSQAHYESVVAGRVTPDDHWLDVGCGRRLLPPWRADAERELVARCARVVGIDPDLASLRDNTSIASRCMGSVDALPFADASFTLVTANMVVEHLASPATELAEIARVLRDGGHLIFHTPNAWAFPTVLARVIPDAPKRWLARALDGRAAKDVFPTYYRANSRARVRALAREAGLEVVELRMVSSTALFALVPPLAVLELLWLRLLGAEPMAGWRSNIIVVLKKASGVRCRASGQQRQDEASPDTALLTPDV